MILMAIWVAMGVLVAAGAAWKGEAWPLIGLLFPAGLMGFTAWWLLAEARSDKTRRYCNACTFRWSSPDRPDGLSGRTDPADR
jgi:hypothetical protein